MKGLQNFLVFFFENYVSILVCLGLVIGLVKKVKDFLGKSDEEKIAIVAQILSDILK